MIKWDETKPWYEQSTDTLGITDLLAKRPKIIINGVEYYDVMPPEEETAEIKKLTLFQRVLSLFQKRDKCCTKKSYN